MIVLNLRKVLLVFVILSVVIIALGVGREIYLFTFGAETFLRRLRHFELDGENTAIVWYSSLLILVNAAVLAVISILAAKRNHKMVFQWRLLAFVFVFLSLDETASFHESAAAPVKEALGLSGYFEFGWIVPAIMLVAVFVIYYTPFLFSLPRHIAVRFLFAGGVFVGGAVGLEMVGGNIVDATGSRTGVYLVASTIEETFEIIGMTLFLAALLRYLKEMFGEWTIGVTEPQASMPPASSVSQERP